MSEYLSFHLSESFVEEYRDKPVNWGFDIGAGNTLSELTFLTKYSRKKADGTKEKWYEVCRRCIEGMYSILKDHCGHQRTPWNEFKAQKAAQDAFDRMFHFKWTPPGRGMWAMGTEYVHLNQSNSSLNNCFAGGETFLTREYGLTEFADVVDEEVTVWADGWKSAFVSEFGVQSVQRVTIKPFGIRSNVRQSITVTPDHRWLLSSNNETTSLSVGDVIKGSVVVPELGNKVYYDGLVHGLVFGDGTHHPAEFKNGDSRFHLVACDSRVQTAMENPEIKNRVNTVYFASGTKYPSYSIRSTINMKDYPVNNDPSYLRGFIEGWILADGSDGNGTYKLCTQNVYAADWLYSHASLAGFTVIGDNFDPVMETNFGFRKNPMRRFTLADGIFDWTVSSIEALDEDIPVYCATVPEVGMFTLSGGQLTGNCAFLSTEKLSTHSAYEATMPFARLMEMSMNGVGVGFDTKGAGKLTIWEPVGEPETFVVEDTREGWAESISVQLESYFFKNRQPVKFDYAVIRPAGSPLKSFGGTASGPGPLMDVHDSIDKQFAGRHGEKITSRDIVDIMNKIGKAVVAGGARRSALIALGESEDEDYVNLKNWELPENAERTGPDGWAWTSNNSVLVNSGDTLDHLVDKIAINGEPGVIWLDMMRRFGRMADPENNRDYRVSGCNPCAEISLESHEFCCLVELYPSKHDSFTDFKKSIKHAYMYAKAVTLMPSTWAETNEVITRNRRIGISMTGIVDFIELQGWSEMQSWMDEGYQYLNFVDTKYSEWLGVRNSVKLTTVKPAGTTSIIAGTTSGVHWPTTSGYYIRRIRFHKTDPLVPILKKAGYHVEDDVMDSKSTVVASFPTRGLDVRSELEVSIWEKASLAAMAQRYWADNMVSVTVSFKEAERDQISPLLRSLQGQVKSLSFLPISEAGTTYAQAPYEPISESEALKMMKKIKPLDLDALYTKADDGSGEKFCTTDSCEIDFGNA